MKEHIPSPSNKPFIKRFETSKQSYFLVQKSLYCGTSAETLPLSYSQGLPDSGVKLLED